MRQIVLDTETTGLEPSKGHRVIEIGCVELENRKLTGRHFHCYINPQREIDEGAIKIHGISNEFLVDKPLFSDVIDDFIEYVSGAELVIHNAPFDIGFLNHEFRLHSRKLPLLDDICSVVDTLLMAKHKHPGQKNNLDALCKRYGVDNSKRELHGALLDAQILADVYLLMTGGQTGLFVPSDSNKQSAADQQANRKAIDLKGWQPPVIPASQAELEAHDGFLDLLDKKSAGRALWKN